MNDFNACFRQGNANINADNLSSAKRKVEDFNDYNVRIWHDENGFVRGFYINADFNSNDNDPYNGIFYHQSDDYLSIEIGTHNESLIAEATTFCKNIAENFMMLDELIEML